MICNRIMINTYNKKTSKVIQGLIHQLDKEKIKKKNNILKFYYKQKINRLILILMEKLIK